MAALSVCSAAVAACSPASPAARVNHFIYKWFDADPVGARINDVLASLERSLAAIDSAAGLEAPQTKVTFLHCPDRDTGHAYQAHHGKKLAPRFQRFG